MTPACAGDHAKSEQGCGDGGRSANKMRLGSIIILVLIALTGCSDKAQVGSYLVPKKTNVTPEPYDIPGTAFINTPQGNKLGIFSLKDSLSETEGNSDVQKSLTTQINFATRQKIQWIRAFSGVRSDGIPFFQADYRRLNVGTEINAKEAISVYRVYYFPESQVKLSGLLTKGELDTDYAYIDAFADRFEYHEPHQP